MDIIAEILEAERIADEKLRAAEAKSRQLLKECEEYNRKLKEQSVKNIEHYSADKNAEADREIAAEAKQIKVTEQKKIDELDNIYEQNHVKWEEEITQKVVAL